MNKMAKGLVDASFGVDSRYKSLDKKLSEGKKLMEARLERLNQLSRSDIIKGKLLQLKFKMEDFIKEPVYEDNNFFTSFLSDYIDTIYEQRALFAKDLSITPVGLSQIINNHREPKEEFMLRLMLHSELAYQDICDFKKKIWYQVYYHEKVSKKMAKQEVWRPVEKRHVQIRNAVLK